LKEDLVTQDTFPTTVVATKTFAAAYDGEQVEITADRSRLDADHEIVRGHPDAFRSLGPDPEPATPEEAFARYANEHGMAAALERLTELASVSEYMNAHARALQQRVPFDHERASRLAYTRARNKIAAACVLAAPSRMVVAAGSRPLAAGRTRRERPRARRSVASRDGPGELEPPLPAPSRRRPGVRS
jgi:hypothetical protein